MRTSVRVIAVGVLAFALVGCGRLSAAQTAHQLQRVVRPHSHVRCVAISGAWNYSCRMTLPARLGAKTVTTLVMVDAHKIIDIGG